MSGRPTTSSNTHAAGTYQSRLAAWLPVLKKTGCWLLILLPAILLNRMIQEYKVNIPFLDDWMFVDMDVKAAAGQLTWQDFFLVQMEHRMAFVRGVIMLFHHYWPGEYTRQMWFTWLLLCFTTANVGLLIRRTSEAAFAQWWPLLALASVSILSPMQYRIVLWPMMFQVACPAFFLTTALVVLLRPNWPARLRLVLAVICAECATQTFATGLLVWVLMVPMIWWSSALKPGRDRQWFLVAWLLVFGVTAVLYFHGLKNEVDGAFSYKQGEEATMGRNVSEFVRRPKAAASFILRFLGCHLARGSSLSLMHTSLWLGGASLALFGACGGYWLRHFREQALRERLLPWLLLGTYSVGAAFLTSLGRSWATTTGDNAVHARYVIHAVPLTVALVVLVWLIARHLGQHRPDLRRFILQSLTAGAFALIFMQAISWSFGWRMMAVWESSRLRGAANTLFYKLPLTVEGDVAGNRNLARKADDLGHLRPAMLKNSRLDNFSLTPKLLSSNTAELSACVVQTNEQGAGGVVWGYACLPNRERVADAVLLTYKDPHDGHWEIFHVTQVTGLPLYFMEVMSRDLQFTHVPEGHLPNEGLAKFTGQFSFEQLPPGVHRVMAWALDYRGLRVFPMRGFFLVDTQRGRVKRLGNDPKSVNLDWFIEKGLGNPNWETLK
ncbi:hypothetical protein [Verrucomicrobium sp. BvORR034]|uniref:hypothetical protein n=1 Tax=Verrucomicrobium sp. BvORR034 TaxID=1396418 RepID=UPI000678918D|nr:hypothetical protein [Verrucomicrobium sp. BvORR034]